MTAATANRSTEVTAPSLPSTNVPALLPAVFRVGAYQFRRSSYKGIHMDRNDMVAKVQHAASTLADRVRDAKLDERAAEIAELALEKVREADLDIRAAELTAAARQKVSEAGVDDKAAELVARLRETPVALQAAGIAGAAAVSARETTERTLDRVGDRLSEGRMGDALGLKRRRQARRWPVIAAAALAAGAAAGFVVFRRRDDAISADWPPADFEPVHGGTAAPAVDLPLDGRVREALGQDARTSAIAPLNVNVVDGTVFVRGFVGPDVDVEALRSVIEGVEGVTDVDLQVNVTA